ncbi:MAK10-like protein [Tanacetum coccineum]
MKNENPIRTLGDYSRPSHKGYRNTIELPDGNNVVPLRSDTIRLVQNGCSFHGLRSEDPNQHPMDFLKLVDSLDLHGESLSEAWTRFKDLLQKVPHHGIDLWLQVQIFYDHVNPATRRTIDQSARGKLRDKNAEESWALLEDLALYDNKSWNDQRDFAKPVKAIFLPQDVPSTSDRWLVSNFMESHDARLSKFEAHFKPQQGEVINKIDTFLKAINDRMMGALPSDMVKNPKLNVNSTSLVFSARSYPMEDPQCSSHIHNLINAIKIRPKKALEDKFKDFHLNLPVLEVLAHALMYNALLDKYVGNLEVSKNGSVFIQSIMLEEMKDPELFTLPYSLGDSKPFDTLADLGSYVSLNPLYLFKKLKIRLPEETDHVFRLADGTKSYDVGIVKNVEVHIGRLKLLDDFYVIDMDKDPATPLLVGRGFLATANVVIDYRKAKIAVGEGITSTNGVGARPPFYVKKDFVEHHLPWEWQLARDTILNPFKDVLVFRKMVEFLGAIPINLKGNT